jgi:hypothetical protein
LALLQILAVLAVFCLGVNEDTRYLLPALPAFAVLLMWGLAQIARRAITSGVLALGLAQWAAVYAIAFGAIDNHFDRWLVKLDRDPTAAGEVARLVEMASAEPELANRFHVVGVELPWLNLNSLNYCAAKKELETGRRGYFRSLGFAETDLRRAVGTILALRTIYFISVEPDRQPQPPDFLNKLSLPMLEAVARSARFRRAPFDSERGVLVWRQVEPKATPASP